MNAGRLPGPLVAISPGDLDARGTRPFALTVARCVERGLRALVVREPELSDKAVLELVRDLREHSASDLWLSVHDRVHLAEAGGADAVHLGFRSLSPREARAILPAHVAIGFSAHADDEPRVREGAEWLLFGPVLDTPSKRALKEPQGFDGLARAASASPIPLWALGGMKPEHANAALDAGARGIAVLSGIFGAPDPEAACARYLDALRASGAAGR
jgi:thiamine-phosphate diphosphorylase